MVRYYNVLAYDQSRVLLTHDDKEVPGKVINMKTMNTIINIDININTNINIIDINNLITRCTSTPT